MDILITDKLITLLLISVTFSVFLMALVQKIKKIEIITKDYQVWLINLLLAFLMGIPFSKMFFDVTTIEAIWVCIFGFIGAPTLYETLKKQNIINYKPNSMNDNSVSIPLENEIKRTDKK